MNFVLQIPVRYKTIFSAYLSRSIILSCKFVTVPILLLYLPRQEYAILAVLAGIEAWFLLLDFGMGSSAQNTLAENQVEGIEEGSFIKTTLLVSCFSLFIGGFVLYYLAPALSGFFLPKLGSVEKIQEIFSLAGCFFVLGTWGSIGGKILVARQKGYQMYLVQSAAHLISLACIVGVGLFGNLSLPIALVFSLGIPAIASFLLTIKIFYQADWKGPFQWKMLRRAKDFWLFALLAAIVSLSDSLIITRTLSIEEIVEYNVLCKIFGIASFAYAAFLQVLMPECSQQLLLGKVREVEETIYKHCFKGILGICLFTCFIWSLAPFIEQSFQVSLGWIGIGAFGLYLSVRIMADFFAMALQSHSKLTPFFYLVPIQALLSLSLQYFLSVQWGIPGILMGLALSYALTVCWALPRELKKVAVRQS